MKPTEELKKYFNTPDTTRLHPFCFQFILLTTYLVSAVALASLAVILQLPQGTTPNWLMLLTIAVSMIVYTAGVLPMPYVVMTELFNIQV